VSSTADGGLDHLLYMTSESDKDGSITITLTFAQGTDTNIAQVRFRTNCSSPPRLPQAVQQQDSGGEGTRNFLLVVGFVSEDDSMAART